MNENILLDAAETTAEEELKEQVENEIGNVEPSREDVASSEVERETALFELAKRKAMVYATSSLVPKQYSGKSNLGNVMISMNMANRMGVDVLQVMQNLYVVHGKPGWSAQFLIAAFNTCGRFSTIRYQFNEDKSSCRATTIELATGEVLQGTEITLDMAEAEGWSTKAGSKWKTMPEQMLRYRAATFLIRAISPEIGLGFSTADELTDIGQ